MDINLFKILNNYWENYNKIHPEVILDVSFVDKVILKAMKDVCDKSVDLCSKNAELASFDFNESWMNVPFNCTIDDYENIHDIYKNSILKTKNQIV